MITFRNMTIKYKLMTIVIAACTAGLTLAGMSFLGWERNSLYNDMVKVLTTRAEILGENCSASLTFQDNKDAEKVLQALHVDSSMISGFVFDSKDELFAAYYRNGSKIKAVPEGFKKTTVTLTKDSLTVSAPIILDKETIGTICLQSDLSSIKESMKRGALIIITVMVLSLLAVFLVSARLQRVISVPILNLAQLARDVSEKKNYSARAIKQSNDEIGSLIDAFNEMLVQIQQRDSELFVAKQGLEVKVEERTIELAKANDQMSKEITDRRKAQDELVQLLSLHSATLESTADGIYVVDLNGKAISYNQKFLMLWQIPESVAAAQDDEKLLAFVLNQLNNPEKFISEVKRLYSNPLAESLDILEFKDGRVYERCSKPQRIDNKVVGRVWSFRDVTERKEAEKKLQGVNAELEGVNQELKNFVYIASHDLREPLRKISAFGSMLEKSLKGKLVDDDAENLSFMIEGAGRMTKMIEGLLAYSRVSSKACSAETVNLNDIVEQLRQLELSMLLEEKHTTIDVPRPLPEVEVDPVQIRQLMQNLIANGMKYQAKGNVPHVTITSNPAADGMVRINVTDNGIGIAPEFQQAIFVMFKRLHTKNEYEGTGIGLAVCKKIVERNGGQLGVESEPGKGSTFWFTVPAAKQSAAIGQKIETSA